MLKQCDGPSDADLRRLFSYDPETGVFSRRCRSSHAFPGDRVGTLRPDGYLKASIRGKSYLLHRLAIQYATGEYPKREVDHINGDKADNRLCNLRIVDSRTNKENRHNTWKTKRSSKYLGVMRAPNGKWRAAITINYKGTYIGTYDTEEEAHEAYLRRKREAHAGCTL